MRTFDFSELENSIKELVKPQRFRHIQGVMYTSASLAMKYGYEIEALRDQELADYVEKALLAGLMHDNAKNISDSELLKRCEKHHLPISADEKKAPYLLHAKLGAYYAKNKYQITDQEVLNAISYHTTGRPSMSTLEKIVYIADYIEPNRYKQPNLSYLRYLAFTDLDACVLAICEDTLAYLQGEQLIDETTVVTRDYYKNIMSTRIQSEVN